MMIRNLESQSIAGVANLLFVASTRTHMHVHTMHVHTCTQVCKSNRTTSTRCTSDNANSSSLIFMRGNETFFCFFVSYYSRLKQYIRHGGKKQDEPLRVMEAKVQDMTCQPITGLILYAD